MTMRNLADSEPLNDDYGADLFGPEEQEEPESQMNDKPIQLSEKRAQEMMAAIHLEMTMAQSQREAHVQLAREYERAYRMVDYDKS